MHLNGEVRLSLSPARVPNDGDAAAVLQITDAAPHPTPSVAAATTSSPAALAPQPPPPSSIDAKFEIAYRDGHGMAPAALAAAAAGRGGNGGFFDGIFGCFKPFANFIGKNKPQELENINGRRLFNHATY